MQCFPFAPDKIVGGEDFFLYVEKASNTTLVHRN